MLVRKIRLKDREYSSIESNLPGEVFKDIEGFNGAYQVSNLGRVKSVARITARVNGKALSVKERILRTGKNAKGYPTTSLFQDGRLKTKTIHRLVANAFIPNPDCKKEVDHIDFDRSNNKASNLRWATRSENVKSSYNAGNIKHPLKGKLGRLHHNSKAVKQYDLSGNLIREWESMMDAERAGYDAGSISKCCQKKVKTHRKCKWEFDVI